MLLTRLSVLCVSHLYVDVIHVRTSLYVIIPHCTLCAADSDESELDGGANYLEASLHLHPGYFACSQVWEAHFPLHPRLKTHRQGISM